MLAPPQTPPAVADRSAEMIRGVFEPPEGFVLSAIGRNKLIVLAIAAACAVAGVAVGATRPRTYTASATLQVGQVNPNSPGFLGYVQSASALATAFSRAISAEPVLAAVQRELKLAPSTAAARLSAEPVPLTPSFLVIGTGSSPSAAIQLANVAANAVVEYESESNSANPQASSLLHEYDEASLRLAQDEATLAHRRPGNAASADAQAREQAERNTTSVRLRALEVAYTDAVASQAPRSGLVSLLAAATTASGDANSKIKLFGFIGLLAGILIGCIAAVLRAHQQRRRWLAHE